MAKNKNYSQNLADTQQDIYSNSSEPPVKNGGPNKKIYIGIGIACTVLIAAVVVAVIFLLSGSQGEQAGVPSMTSSSVSSELEALNTNTFYDGILIGGVDVGGMTKEEARKALEEKLPQADKDYDAELTYGEKSWHITKENLIFTSNLDEVLEEAFEYGRKGTDEERLEQVRALEKKPKDFEVKTELDEASIDAALEPICAEINREPEDATISAFNSSTGKFSFKEGVKGVQVDEEKLKQDVRAVLLDSEDGTGTVAITTKEIDFNINSSDLEGNIQKLGSYSTVSTNTVDGTYNMTKALLSINGTCVKAGETFSFLGTAGPCGKAQGYRPAGAIVGGRMSQAYGGGICQASTTIYGAALRSNVQIVQRSNHSIQSTYCPIGQDAAVNYPYQDLKFKNTSKYPLYIVTSVNGRTLTATFYGYQSPDYDRIEVTSQRTEVIAAKEGITYVEDSTLAKGEIRKTAARAGARATAQRVYYKNGKVVKTEALTSSYYPPATAFWAYGPGTDIDSAGSSPASSAKPSPSSSAAPKPPVVEPSDPEEPSSAPSSSNPSSSEPSSSAAPDSSQPSAAPEQGEREE